MPMALATCLTTKSLRRPTTMTICLARRRPLASLWLRKTRPSAFAVPRQRETQNRAVFFVIAVSQRRRRTRKESLPKSSTRATGEQIIRSICVFRAQRLRTFQNARRNRTADKRFASDRGRRHEKICKFSQTVCSVGAIRLT